MSDLLLVNVQTSLRPQVPSKGAWLYCGAVLIMALMYALIKVLSQTYPAGQILFFRASVGLVPMIVLALCTGGVASLKTTRPGAHILRGLISLCTMGSLIFAFGVLPIADAYALSFVAPLFVAALAMPMLGEAVPARQWMAILVGFYGVLVILRPGQVGMDFIAYAGMMAALAGSFTYAVTLVTARAIGQVESPAAVGFYPALTIAVASLAFLPGNFVVPSGTDLALLCLIGLMGGLSTILLNEAFRIAPSAYLAPLDYTAIIWALIIGLTVWGDVPDALTINGGALVVLSGLYVTRLSRDRASVKSA